MPAQTEMFLPLATDAIGVEHLVGFLRGRDWINAKGISAETGWDDRKIRALASESDEIGSGNGGYKLLVEMTADEYHAYRSRILNQTEVMRDRIRRNDRIFYARRPL